MYLFGCSRDAPHIDMNTKDSHGVKIVLEGDDAFDIHDDAFVIAYLEVGEVLIGLTSKEWNHVMHGAKQFKWEGDSFLQMWANGRM